MNNQNCQVVRDLKAEYGDSLISIYTREQAIADGVLVDLSKLYPSETRVFKYPVACTEVVWNKIKKYADQHGNPAVWDLCWMSIKAKTTIISESEHLFECNVPIDAKRPTEFKIHCGAGDNYEPVITIMMPYED